MKKKKKKKKPKSKLALTKSQDAPEVDSNDAIEVPELIEEVPVSKPEIVALADLPPNPYFVEAAKYLDTTHASSPFEGYSWDVEGGGEAAKLLARLIPQPKLIETTQ